MSGKPARDSRRAYSGGAGPADNGWYTAPGASRVPESGMNPATMDRVKS